METYYYGRQSILTGRRSGYSVVSTLTEITEGVRGVVRTPAGAGMRTCFIYLFIYLLKSTYETNKANDITVGQKGT